MAYQKQLVCIELRNPYEVASTRTSYTNPQQEKLLLTAFFARVAMACCFGFHHFLFCFPMPVTLRVFSMPSML